MRRRQFLSFLISAAFWPLKVRAQNQVAPDQSDQNHSDQNQVVQTADDSVGQVSTVQGSATVTRANVAPVALKANDPINEGDVLMTGVNSILGVTFDDETTFSLSPNSRIVVDNYVYQVGASGNIAAFSVAQGTVAFVANQVAKTGDMAITTPTATLGIRGTTGVVDVPENEIGRGKSS